MMGVPKNGWFIYNRKSYLKMDDNWGYPHDLGNLNMGTVSLARCAVDPASASDGPGVNGPVICLKLKTYTLWLFNIAMENCLFIDNFPIKTSIYKGFSMAMLNNQMVNGLTMVYGRYNCSIHKVYKPTFTSLVPSCMNMGVSSKNINPESMNPGTRGILTPNSSKLRLD